MRLTTVVGSLALLACAHARPLGGMAGSIVNFLQSRTGSASSVKVSATSDAPYWLADINHQGIAAFNANPSGYTVFRNVKNYGAKGIVDLILPKTKRMANVLYRRRGD